MLNLCLPQFTRSLESELKNIVGYSSPFWFPAAIGQIRLLNTFLVPVLKVHMHSLAQSSKLFNWMMCPV